MAEDEDNFDLDIYGDDTVTATQEHQQTVTNPEETLQEEQEVESTTNEIQTVESDNQKSSLPQPVPTVPPTPRGVKRKSLEERPVHPFSSTSLQVTELNWWVTEEEIRGWCAGAGVEEDVRDISFNEHKVNGKSKGQVYIDLGSLAAATSLKHHIDNLGPRKSDPKKPVTAFYHGQWNPYKTLPKDSVRQNTSKPPTQNFNNHSNVNSNNTNGSNNHNIPNNNTPAFNQTNYQNSSFRGGRGGGRGIMNYNSNFQGHQMPNAMAPMGGMPMAQYPNQMNTGGYQNFNNRGNMMGGGMRGSMRGRGGIGGGGMMNPMGMGMAMPMNPMNMMGMGTNAFNPGFFQNPNTGVADWGNSHPKKRPRPNE